jgi:hypothetical protein
MYWQSKHHQMFQSVQTLQRSKVVQKEGRPHVYFIPSVVTSYHLVMYVSKL